MAEVVTFPDVVRALIPYLTSRLTARDLAAPVSSRVPNPRPARFVKVTAAGGTLTGVASASALVLVECWAADEVAAHDLAEACATEMRAATRSQDPIAAGVWIGGTDDAVSIPVNFPDPLTSSARFQFTASLYLAGQPL